MSSRNFELFLTLSPIITIFITKALVLSSYNPWSYVPKLTPWRDVIDRQPQVKTKIFQYLWTTLY